jgi:signal transduction histidine kinase
MQGPFQRDPLTEPGGAPTPWEEMLAYVDFSPDDAARLLTLLPFAEAHFFAITDRFYARVLGFPGARAVLTHDGQVERLKGTLRAWMADLLRGPHDLTYWQKRRRIGQVHVRVGLPERYVFTALNLIRQDLCEIAAAALPQEEVLPTCHALLKITDLEMAVMSGAYHEAHEERRLRSLQDLIVQNLPVTVLCLDENGRVTSATRPSSRLLGATAEVGRHYETFLPESLIEAADLHTHVGRALATGHEISIPRAVLGTKDQARHFRLTLVPLDHELARLLIHIEELTDVVRAEHRLNQAEALARVGGLAAHLAHEIRNPLAAISATLQVITASFPAEDRRRAILSKVQDQVHRLDRLVSDLLGYARPVSARLERLDLAQLAREAISQSNVESNLEGLDCLFARADAQYLSQVLVNLLQNASEAMSHLDPKPPVRVRLLPGPAIEVCDHGPGIHADVRERLFEPFVTTKTKGTGLGLAISRKLMIGMGGNLVLTDHPAPGACFRIELTEAT